ncbi:MAG: TolC family protein [Deltaproteobacteria bacterium]|nr:TolC family protein [Deltaproteobacteria bacterium]
MNRHSIAELVLLAALSCGAAARADGPELGGKAASLADCVRQAVARNLGLQAERLVREQAALAARASEESFWPGVEIGLGYADAREPLDAGGVASSGTLTYDAALVVRTPVGTDVRASLTNGRRGTDDAGAAFDPEHSARLELRITQPLLAGFGLEVNTAPIEHARLAHRRAVADFRARLNDLVLEVEQAYWDLFFSQQDVELKARSLERAQRQYGDTAENIRRGLLPEHDIYVVEENVVSFERKLLQARNALAAARSALAERMQLDPAEADGLVAGEQPDPERIQPASPEALLTSAKDLNPELLAARTRFEEARIDLAVAENERLPGLDLDAGLRYNGLGGAVGDAWERIGEGDDRELFAGLRLNVPIFRLFDDAIERQAHLELQRRKLEHDERLARLGFELRDAHRDILHGLRSLELAGRVSELARQKLEAQQEKYKAGVAPLKDLVQFLRELDEAELARLQVLVDLSKNAAELHRQVGDLHTLRGIEVRE